MTAPLRARSTPWSTGLTLTGFALVVTVVTIVAFGLELGRVHPLLAVIVNLVAAAGIAPTLWWWRRVPLWRWIVAGVAAGVPVGWIVLLGVTTF
ncbi:MULTISPECIES: DUF2537 domain-containing protein [Rhodococcus]|uniref:DUF2537 domain-containing protein n=1 Tax=Rhodococcus TaxID=1827 RepID=UPI00193BAD85|nr:MULTISPECIES: DUF2537 domain-containing protein [Rhodococcus]QRI75660.1 DUF2537 domain-containing protein [Rhodococcus aetherivorans]QSE59069.1 DUF2537 domain-containing protein [Rhodococcus sp. PSBB066]QSE69609.1 DUF2537 domain-containing protein [Rhodococcus sp. PSBB049]